MGEMEKATKRFLARRDVKKLLDNREVVQEINRHLWIESEKVGHNIGFEQAAADWIKRFSSAWVEYHMLQAKAQVKRSLFRRKKRR